VEIARSGINEGIILDVKVNGSLASNTVSYELFGKSTLSTVSISAITGRLATSLVGRLNPTNGTRLP
jgi:hypothetical protein